MVRVVIGIILLALAAYGVREWQKWRARVKAEDQLEAAQAEKAALDVQEQTRKLEAKNEKRRGKLKT